MANIWTENRSLNNENSQYSLKTKQTLAPLGSRSVKKTSAFSEIKNVIHNQIYATPLRGNAAKIDGLPSAFGSSKSLCTDLLRKQQLKQNFAKAQHKIETGRKIKTAIEVYQEPEFDEGLFDSWDKDRVCCKEQKREAEIWAEMDMLDMNLKDFKMDSSLDDDDYKDDLLAFIPELDNFPDIPDIDQIEPENADDFRIPALNFDLDNFDDELPF